jgi:hypothetical protein
MLHRIVQLATNAPVMTYVHLRKPLLHAPRAYTLVIAARGHTAAADTMLLQKIAY